MNKKIKTMAYQSSKIIQRIFNPKKNNKRIESTSRTLGHRTYLEPIETKRISIDSAIGGTIKRFKITIIDSNVQANKRYAFKGQEKNQARSKVIHEICHQLRKQGLKNIGNDYITANAFSFYSMYIEECRKNNKILNPIELEKYANSNTRTTKDMLGNMHTTQINIRDSSHFNNSEILKALRRKPKKRETEEQHQIKGISNNFYELGTILGRQMAELDFKSGKNFSGMVALKEMIQGKSFEIVEKEIMSKRHEVERKRIQTIYEEEMKNDLPKARLRDKVFDFQRNTIKKIFNRIKKGIIKVTQTKTYKNLEKRSNIKINRRYINSNNMETAIIGINNLVKLRDIGSEKQLIKILKNPKKNVRVRLAAAKALGSIKGPKSQKALLESKNLFPELIEEQLKKFKN